MDRASIAAEVAARRSTSDVTHIYRDGYILFLAISQETEVPILKVLGDPKEGFPTVEAARSKDGMYVTVILPCQPTVTLTNLCSFFTDGYHEHRETIEEAIDLFRRGLEALER